MISFLNDYSQTAHQEILNRLISPGYQSYPGYGLDDRSHYAAKLIKQQLGCDADIHFMIGGTSCNKTVIAHALKPYESVIAVTTGHINVHETGAIEASGHKINLVNGLEGKITAEKIQEVLSCHIDEHMVVPKMVYISNSTETGTIYSKSELASISKICKQNNLYLYLDGARLGVALTADNNDLSLNDIAALTDIFYIGGTKNGALLGEAAVIVNEKLKKGFRHSIKQNGGLLAKGFIIGLQFEALFTDNLFFRLAAKANQTAKLLRNGLIARKINLTYPAPTNQIFAAFSDDIVKGLSKKYLFEQWEKLNGQTVIRLVTSWATESEDIASFLSDLDEMQKQKR